SLEAGRAAEGVLERGNELRAPEAAVVSAGPEPQAVAQAKRREEAGEPSRPPRRDPVVGRAAGEEEARAEPAQERRLAPDEERRVVRRPDGGVGAPQRAVARRVEGAAPGLERPEEPRVAQADVDRAVAPGGEAGERPL